MELSGRTNKAADANGVPPELRQALENLGAQMAEAGAAEQRSADNQAQNVPGGKDALAFRRRGRLLRLWLLR